MKEKIIVHKNLVNQKFLYLIRVWILTVINIQLYFTNFIILFNSTTNVFNPIIMLKKSYHIQPPIHFFEFLIHLFDYLALFQDFFFLRYFLLLILFMFLISLSIQLTHFFNHPVFAIINCNNFYGRLIISSTSLIHFQAQHF